MAGRREALDNRRVGICFQSVLQLFSRSTERKTVSGLKTSLKRKWWRCGFQGTTAEEIAACVPVHTIHRQLWLAQVWLLKEVSR